MQAPRSLGVDEAPGGDVLALQIATGAVLR